MESEESSTPNFKLDDNFVSLEKDTEMKMLFDHRDMINIVQKLNVLQKRKLIRTDVKELCNKASNSLWAHRLFEQTLCWYHNKRKPRQLTTSFLMAHRELLSEMINSDLDSKAFLERYEQDEGPVPPRDVLNKSKEKYSLSTFPKITQVCLNPIESPKYH